MDVVVLCNGLGNQMSQYAFYLQKKLLDPNTELIIFCNDHNGFELETIFNIKYNKSVKQKILYSLFRILLTEKLPFFLTPIKRLLNYNGCKIIKENFQYNFNPKFLEQKKGIYFYFGGWHSESYFISAKDNILKSFVFKFKPTDSINLSHINLIREKESVSIHIRRGDFLNNDNFELFGKVCDIKYYMQAIDEIQKYVKAPHYFIFSNDMEWVKSNFQFENVTFIEGNTGENSWKDLYLMSICKNQIIANSSFSWWGGWLNSNKTKIVISPNIFSTKDINSDVYPKEWIKICKKYE